MGYYIDQLAEQDRQKRLADLLAMQQDNSEPGVQFDTPQQPIPQQGSLSDLMNSGASRDQINAMLSQSTITSPGFDAAGTVGRGEPYMPPPPLPQNYIKNERTGAVTDLGQSQPAGPALDYSMPIEFGGMGKGYRLKGDATRAVLANGQIVSMGRDTGAERARMKEDLGLQKQRAEIANLTAKQVDTGSWDTVESNGKQYLINKKTGQIKPAEIGGTQLMGKKPDAVSKKEAQMEGIGDVISEARSVLEGTSPGQKSKPTGSGLGALWDTVSAQVGAVPSGANEAQRMKVLGGALTSKMPRMEGPQSDKDTQLYKEMAGLIGDDTVPISRRIEALGQVEKLWSKYEKKAPTETPSGFDTDKERRYQEWKKSRGM